MELYPVHFFGNELGMNSLDLAKIISVTNARIIHKIKCHDTKYRNAPYYKTYVHRQRLGTANKPTTIVYFNRFVLKLILLDIYTLQARQLLYRLIVEDEKFISSCQDGARLAEAALG